MGDLMTYIQKLELFGFFSGYCLIYSLINSFKNENNGKGQTLLHRVTKLLPYAYALTATLYAGMILKNISLDLSIRNVHEQFHIPFLQILALLGVLFWIPFFSKKTVISLMHSLVFFLFMLRDIYFQSKLSGGKEIIRNDMKVFADSLLLNLITLVFVVLMYFFFVYVAQIKRRSS